MTSVTRRGFISRGLAGATTLELVTTGKTATMAAGTPAAVPIRLNSMKSASQTKASAEITLTGKAIRQGFGGVGFHAQMFLEACTQDFFEQVLSKRWRELNPRFARIFHSWAPGEPEARERISFWENSGRLNIST